ncbi:hypothetical protein HDU67_001319 [Dinochytrium kinnereticum]|nr:hypothetical protein HDU67_001319 [Dinochytrium kinnereticum]
MLPSFEKDPQELHAEQHFVAGHAGRLDLLEPVKIGRKVNAKVGPEPNNGIFDSKVLSRNHAEIWYEDEKVLIKDVKSSNGTFVNGTRLSEEGQVSAPHELQTGDMMEFGIDIMNDDGVSSGYFSIHSSVTYSFGDAVMFHKVACLVTVLDGSGSIRPSQAMEAPKASRRSIASLNEEKALALEAKAELDSMRTTIAFLENHFGRPLAARGPAELDTAASAAVAAELAAAKAASSAAETVAGTLKMQLKDASDEAKMWRERWESLREDMGKRKDEAEKALEQRRLEAEASSNAFSVEIETWKAKTEQALADVEFLKKKELAAIKAATAAASAQREHLESLEVEIKRLKDENATLREESLSKSVLIDSLKKEIADMNPELLKLRQATSDSRRSEDEIKELREGLKIVEDKLFVSTEEATLTHEKLKSSENTVASLARKSNLAEEKARMLEEKLRVSEDKLRLANAKVQDMEKLAQSAKSIRRVPSESDVRRRTGSKVASSPSKGSPKNSVVEPPKDVPKQQNNAQVIYYFGFIGIVAVSIYMAMGSPPLN